MYHWGPPFLCYAPSTNFVLCWRYYGKVTLHPSFGHGFHEKTMTLLGSATKTVTHTAPKIRRLKFPLMVQTEYCFCSCSLPMLKAV